MEALQKFIKDYFTRLNLSNMPEKVKKHFDGMVKNKDFPNKDVKSWEKSLDANGNWKSIPTLGDPFATPPVAIPAEYETIDLNNLYRILLGTFYNMSIHSASMDDDTKDFIKAYFGDKKTFHAPKMSNTEENEIRKFLELLFGRNNDDVQKLRLVSGEDKVILKKAYDKNISLDDPRVKNAISNAIGQFRRYEYSGYDLDNDSGAAKLKQLKLNQIENAVDTSVELVEPTPDDINNLRKDIPNIFKTLYKKNKTYEAFKKYEPGEKVISEKVDEALANTDYTGNIKAENYIAPKYEDDLNAWQKINETLEDTYSDVLKKYLTLHRANLYMKKTSKKIVETLEKEKIKPTDGLEAIIEKSEGISGKLKGKEPFDASGHFDWMIKKLKSYKDNGMGKAIKTALHNRRQLEHIVEQLIFDAVEEGKVDAAKTALEVLSVMQYGMFNSRAMEAINGIEANLLSDSKYSFNKNPYIKGVLAALDWTLKKGGQLFGYALTAIWNKGVRTPSNVLKNSQRLQAAIAKEDINLKNEKSDFDAEKLTQDANDEALKQAGESMIIASQITDLQAERNKLSKGRVDEKSLKATLDQAEEQMEQPKQRYEQLDQDYENAKQTYDQAKQEHEQEKAALKRVYELLGQRPKISKSIGQIKAKLKQMPNPAPDQLIQSEIDKLKADLEKKTKDLQSLETELDQIEKEHPRLAIRNKGTNKRSWKSKLQETKKQKDAKNALAAAEQARNSAKSRYDAAKANYQTAENNYNNKHAENEKIEYNIALYLDGKRQIKSAEEALRKREEKSQKWPEEHKNDYLELMALWGFLQTGDTKHLLHWSTKNMQEEMDSGKMSLLFSQYRQNNGL